jgi:hypothetical protein
MTKRKDKTSPITINKRERAIQALELRKAGISYEMIAQRLGYANRTSAYRAVSTVLDNSEKEASSDLREMELRRLDDLFLSIYKKARDGDYAAIDRCLKIMERRAKIAGLDAPEKAQSDVRQVIKVVYEDVQYAEQFEEQPTQDAQLLTIDPSVYAQFLAQQDNDQEEYEDEDESDDSVEDLE